MTPRCWHTAVGVIVAVCIDTLCFAQTDDPKRYSRGGVVFERSRAEIAAAPPGPIVGGPVEVEPDGFTLMDLVTKGAPTLSFSPDEPLIRYDRDRVLPNGKPNLLWPLPDEEVNGEPLDPKTPVVYFRIRSVATTAPADAVLACGRNCRWSDAPDSDAFALDTFMGASVLYLFYYPRDYGLGSHDHDLEAVEVEFGRDVNELGVDVVRVTRVLGAAHGLGWYTNELRLKVHEEFVFPLHLLVEEGKHASAPDRNADGVYTPLYDVTHYPRDAWGVRDTLRSRYLPGNSFRAEMMKPRDRGFVMRPPNEDGDASSYVLLQASDSAYCPDRSERIGMPPDPVPGRSRLHGLMKGKGFCDESRARPGALAEPGPIITHRPFGRRYESLAAAARWERGHPGVYLKYFGIRAPLIDGWLAPTITWTRLSAENDKFSFEASYSPSASRLADWYASLGPEVERRRTEDGAAETSWRFAVEGGLLLRLPLPGNGPFGLLNLRAGVRTRALDDLASFGVVVSVGLGPF